MERVSAEDYRKGLRLRAKCEKLQRDLNAAVDALDAHSHDILTRYSIESADRLEECDGVMYIIRGK